MQQFALQDTTRGVSHWCKVGDVFGDLAIKTYDGERETLICRGSDGIDVKLVLNASVVRQLKSTPAGKQYGQVFVAADLFEKFQQQGLSKADVFDDAMAALEAELARAVTDQDRTELKALIEGFRAGRVRLYNTGGKPLRYEDAPNLSKEAVDRVNQLQTMSKEQVDAMIQARKQAKEKKKQ